MELALGQKGRVFPPPTLDKPFQTVVKSISDWDDIVAATHWHLYHRGEIDGADFYVKERELGHIHLDGRVHLATNLFLCKALRHRGLANEFPFAGYEHWVSFNIRTKTDAEHATWLFRLNYHRLQGMGEEDLLNRINQIPTTNTQLTE